MAASMVSQVTNLKFIKMHFELTFFSGVERFLQCVERLTKDAVSCSFIFIENCSEELLLAISTIIIKKITSYNKLNKIKKIIKKKYKFQFNMFQRSSEAKGFVSTVPGF